MTVTASDQVGTGVVSAAEELIPLLRGNARRCEREVRARPSSSSPAGR